MFLSMYIDTYFTQGKIRPLNPVDPAGSKLSIDRTMMAELFSGGKLLKPPIEDDEDEEEITGQREGEMSTEGLSKRMLSSSGM